MSSTLTQRTISQPTRLSIHNRIVLVLCASSPHGSRPVCLILVLAAAHDRLPCFALNSIRDFFCCLWCSLLHRSCSGLQRSARHRFASGARLSAMVPSPTNTDQPHSHV